jgi:hypothetical protein
MAYEDIKQHISITERAKWNKVVADFAAHLGAGGIQNHRLGNGTVPGFSMNDFTNTLKTKLDGIEDGALNNPHPATHPWTMITGLATLANTAHWNDIVGKPQEIIDVVNNVYNAFTVGGIRITINSTAPANPKDNKEIWIDNVNYIVNIYKSGWIKLGAVYK